MRTLLWGVLHFRVGVYYLLSPLFALAEFTTPQFDTCKKHKNKVTCPMCRKNLIEPSRFHPAMLLSAMSRSDPIFHEMLLASEPRDEFTNV
jgi:hypothetical protein